ncbi:hypothetical protein AX774_g5449 [Zancudomyces culisetae]|uniref:Anaphase-promoting complex subunit 1 n=1 Tax=Zancudomyces culisetae TaxID=1213189 RepID=A0A1R1PJE0_ZANCU|nr:hypothetical protein AX774_g5449 [Zancudomyces culisetae]|eukprot:OMH81104.1 hypothetical protein AX774_g5449 [Zancudomyces culisetae]
MPTRTRKYPTTTLVHKNVENVAFYQPNHTLIWTKNGRLFQSISTKNFQQTLSPRIYGYPDVRVNEYGVVKQFLFCKFNTSKNLSEENYQFQKTSEKKSATNTSSQQPPQYFVNKTEGLDEDRTLVGLCVLYDDNTLDLYLENRNYNSLDLTTLCITPGYAHTIDTLDTRLVALDCGFMYQIPQTPKSLQLAQNHQPVVSNLTFCLLEDIYGLEQHIVNIPITCDSTSSIHDTTNPNNNQDSLKLHKKKNVPKHKILHFIPNLDEPISTQKSWMSGKLVILISIQVSLHSYQNYIHVYNIQSSSSKDTMNKKTYISTKHCELRLDSSSTLPLALTDRIKVISVGGGHRTSNQNTLVVLDRQKKILRVYDIGANNQRIDILHSCNYNYEYEIRNVVDICEFYNKGAKNNTHQRLLVPNVYLLVTETNKVLLVFGKDQYLPVPKHNQNSLSNTIITPFCSLEPSFGINNAFNNNSNQETRIEYLEIRNSTYLLESGSGSVPGQLGDILYNEMEKLDYMEWEILINLLKNQFSNVHNNNSDSDSDNQRQQEQSLQRALLVTLNLVFQDELVLFNNWTKSLYHFTEFLYQYSRLLGENNYTQYYKSIISGLQSENQLDLNKINEHNAGGDGTTLSRMLQPLCFRNWILYQLILSNPSSASLDYLKVPDFPTLTDVQKHFLSLYISIDTNSTSHIPPCNRCICGEKSLNENRCVECSFTGIVPIYDQDDILCATKLAISVVKTYIHMKKLCRVGNLGIDNTLSEQLYVNLIALNRILANEQAKYLNDGLKLAIFGTIQEYNSFISKNKKILFCNLKLTDNNNNKNNNININGNDNNDANITEKHTELVIGSFQYTATSKRRVVNTAIRNLSLPIWIYTNNHNTLKNVLNPHKPLEIPSLDLSVQIKTKVQAITSIAKRSEITQPIINEAVFMNAMSYTMSIFSPSKGNHSISGRNTNLDASWILVNRPDTNQLIKSVPISDQLYKDAVEANKNAIITYAALLYSVALSLNAHNPVETIELWQLIEDLNDSNNDIVKSAILLSKSIQHGVSNTQNIINLLKLHLPRLSNTLVNGIPSSSFNDTNEPSNIYNFLDTINDTDSTLNGTNDAGTTSLMSPSLVVQSSAVLGLAITFPLHKSHRFVEYLVRELDSFGVLSSKYDYSENTMNQIVAQSQYNLSCGFALGLIFNLLDTQQQKKQPSQSQASVFTSSTLHNLVPSLSTTLLSLLNNQSLFDFTYRLTSSSSSSTTTTTTTTPAKMALSSLVREPAALVALSLVYLDSNDASISSQISSPFTSIQTILALTTESLFLRILASNLINFDSLAGISNRSALLTLIPIPLTNILNINSANDVFSLSVIDLLGFSDADNLLSTYTTCLSSCLLSISLYNLGSRNPACTNLLLECIIYFINLFKPSRTPESDNITIDSILNSVKHELLTHLPLLCVCVGLVNIGVLQSDDSTNITTSNNNNIDSGFYLLDIINHVDAFYPSVLYPKPSKNRHQNQHSNTEANDYNIDHIDGDNDDEDEDDDDDQLTQPSTTDPNNIDTRFIQVNIFHISKHLNFAKNLLSMTLHTPVFNSTNDLPSNLSQPCPQKPSRLSVSLFLISLFPIYLPNPNPTAAATTTSDIGGSNNGNRCTSNFSILSFTNYFWSLLHIFSSNIDSSPYNQTQLGQAQHTHIHTHIPTPSFLLPNLAQDPKSKNPTFLNCSFLDLLAMDFPEHDDRCSNAKGTRNRDDGDVKSKLLYKLLS